METIIFSLAQLSGGLLRLLAVVERQPPRDAPRDVAKKTLNKLKKRKLEETEYMYHSAYQDSTALLFFIFLSITAVCRDEKEDVLSPSLEEMF